MAICLSLFSASSILANEDKVDFESQIRPLLKARCVECHCAKSQHNGLRLDAKKFALDGGDGGPIIVPGHSDESELIRRVTSEDEFEVMPPKGAKLTDSEIALLRTWIEQGAVWPETEEDLSALKDERLDHWAWQSVAPTEPPDTKNPEWAKNPIDAFVLQQLAASDLRPAAEADRRTLIRRLKFDLLGLPPTFQEVEAFVADPDPRAYEKLVDRYLASPHFGERWARHWLDIAHYADTHGFERDMIRKNAWPYRDYVIRAFNDDKPYDQFLEEQIAGDVYHPEDPESIQATGFLAAGPWDYVGQVETQSEVLRRAAQADGLDDLSTQVITATCGMTINCARCHDHKIDPISQREYYALWAVFAGIKQGERPISASEVQRRQDQERALDAKIKETLAKLDQLEEKGSDLADIVGGGDGHGGGAPDHGVDPLNGNPLSGKLGFREGVQVNHFALSEHPFIDGVVIPNASNEGTPVSSTGIRVNEVPLTSGDVWDGIRNGPVNYQHTLKLGGIDFADKGQTLLSLHANAAITFDLDAIRAAGAPKALTFTSQVGYFGKTPTQGAQFAVYVDGRLQTNRHAAIGAEDGLVPIQVALPEEARFLTLMATDGGNGIGHDQIGFGNPRLLNAERESSSAETIETIAQLKKQLDSFQAELKSLADPQQIYSIVSQPPTPVHVLRRGNPEDPQEHVDPGTLSCLGLPAALGDQTTPEGNRRMALAEWIVDPHNPLTRRVMVNRLWHHHFGTGLVDTPSDFGLAGGKPSHPELLDWLADQLLVNDWKLKPLHRLICTSATYRQASSRNPNAEEKDADNRLLSRMNPRKLDAESVRDAVLAVSGKLNHKMYGPGFRDFDYQEAYAPVYDYITPDRAELQRRSIYRFVVRTTPHPYLMTLDCPDPANLTPARNATTTVLQSLTLLNNDFMLQQADHLAEQVRQEAGDSTAAQADAAFRLTLARRPSPTEVEASAELIEGYGLPQLCRMLLNTNEFIYVD
ncbi:DUF1553 domain-containing protein [Blastopirellula sp. J2-11]|uniref:DUF1553 domain-containing protein n=1 Tax=Blastopirellula sp. J2-11 TaxID=2943192 RepID=UPI0021C80AA5|nr:DUF1553 domain-containing protein [Blastopirellula sp. J2-11]UUO04898.1 DUF1553 domain-containing protein [Blastopirellula sp. J2-11]